MSHREPSELDHAEARDLLARALGEEPSMKLDPQAVLGTAKRSLRRSRALMVTTAVAGVMLAGFGTTAIAGGGMDSLRPAERVGKLVEPHVLKCVNTVEEMMKNPPKPGPNGAVFRQKCVPHRCPVSALPKPIPLEKIIEERERISGRPMEKGEREELEKYQPMTEFEFSKCVQVGPPRWPEEVKPGEMITPGGVGTPLPGK